MMRWIDFPQVQLLGQQRLGQGEGVGTGVLVDSIAHPHHLVAHPKGEALGLDEPQDVCMRTEPSEEHGVESLE
jgi:hypothetical protein